MAFVDNMRKSPWGLPIAVIVTLLVYGVTVVWGYAGVVKDVERVQEDITRQEVSYKESVEELKLEIQRLEAKDDDIEDLLSEQNIKIVVIDENIKVIRSTLEQWVRDNNV